MPTELQQLQQRKLIYLITSGETTLATTPATEDFLRLLDLAKAAVKAKIDLFQIREKELSALVLYDLSRSIAAITGGTPTRLLVNDRADIAAAAGADGVHLTTASLPVGVIRKSFGDNFLIGVSTHSASEALAARSGGADFAVFGPIFETPAKTIYGQPQGLDKLKAIASAMGTFPVLALGGIGVERVADCIRAGAQGTAAIRMLGDPLQLNRVVAQIRQSFEQSEQANEGTSGNVEAGSDPLNHTK